jgi:hypothetical protein
MNVGDWFKDWGKPGDPGSCVTSDNVATLDCIPKIFGNVLSALIMFAGIVALVMFMIGSFRLISSRGDPKKIQASKNNFTYGAIGLVIILFSFAIIKIISFVTGVACITTFGFGC